MTAFAKAPAHCLKSLMAWRNSEPAEAFEPRTVSMNCCSSSADIASRFTFPKPSAVLANFYCTSLCAARKAASSSAKLGGNEVPHCAWALATASSISQAKRNTAVF